MSLDSLIEEIRSRGAADLRTTEAKRDDELSQIGRDREARLAAIRTEATRATDAEIARDRAQRIAAAHLAARRLLYEAREERLSRGVEETRARLSDLAAGDEYEEILRRMLASATARLGRGVRVSGRAEDASVLGRVAGKGFDPTPRTILGGLVAETPDGRRRLDLSFDELLRQRADAVRALLA